MLDDFLLVSDILRKYDDMREKINNLQILQVK